MSSSAAPPRDDRAFYEWVDEVGIEAPSIGIAYVGGGFADDAETYRGCVATQPVDRGEVYNDFAGRWIGDDE